MTSGLTSAETDATVAAAVPVHLTVAVTGATVADTAVVQVSRAAQLLFDLACCEQNLGQGLASGHQCLCSPICSASALQFIKQNGQVAMTNTVPQSLNDSCIQQCCH